MISGKSLEKCQHCGTSSVLVESEVVIRIKELLQPNFKTLGTSVAVHGNRYHPICPSCDSYALGLDLVEAFPVLTQSGKITTIHDLMFMDSSLIDQKRQSLVTSLKECIHRFHSSEEDAIWWAAENEALRLMFQYLMESSALYVTPELLKAIEEDGFSDHATSVAELLEEQANRLPDADRRVVLDCFEALWQGGEDSASQSLNMFD